MRTLRITNGGPESEEKTKKQKKTEFEVEREEVV